MVRVTGTRYCGKIFCQPFVQYLALSFTAHCAHETVALPSAETPDFIGPQYWPSNSLDLNPVDYAIWGILQERVYCTVTGSMTLTIERTTDSRLATL